MRFPLIEVFINIDGIIDEIYEQLPDEPLPFLKKRGESRRI